MNVDFIASSAVRETAKQERRKDAEERRGQTRRRVWSYREWREGGTPHRQSRYVGVNVPDIIYCRW